MRWRGSQAPVRPVLTLRSLVLSGRERPAVFILTFFFLASAVFLAVRDLRLDSVSLYVSGGFPSQEDLFFALREAASEETAGAGWMVRWGIKPGISKKGYRLVLKGEDPGLLVRLAERIKSRLSERSMEEKKKRLSFLREKLSEAEEALREVNSRLREIEGFASAADRRVISDLFRLYLSSKANYSFFDRRAKFLEQAIPGIRDRIVREEEVVRPGARRYAELLSEYYEKRSVMKERHPEIRRLRRKLEALRKKGLGIKVVSRVVTGENPVKLNLKELYLRSLAERAGWKGKLDVYGEYVEELPRIRAKMEFAAELRSRRNEILRYISELRRRYFAEKSSVEREFRKFSASIVRGRHVSPVLLFFLFLPLLISVSLLFCWFLDAASGTVRPFHLEEAGYEVVDVRALSGKLGRGVNILVSKEEIPQDLAEEISEYADLVVMPASGGTIAVAFSGRTGFLSWDKFAGSRIEGRKRRVDIYLNPQLLAKGIPEIDPPGAGALLIRFPAGAAEISDLLSSLSLLIPSRPLIVPL